MFESGVADYVHFPITVDIAFPITLKGKPVIACEYCKLFTGRKCVLTHEVILDPANYVGNMCPIKEENNGI
jgi:hypothetical protein